MFHGKCCRWDAENSGSIFDGKSIFTAGGGARNHDIQHWEGNVVTND